MQLYYDSQLALMDFVTAVIVVSAPPAQPAAGADMAARAWAKAVLLCPDFEPL